MTIELLPCPHCGSTAGVHTMPNDGNCNDGGKFVMCSNSRCMASTALLFPLMDNVEGLLAERWNRRAEPSSQEPSGLTEPDLLAELAKQPRWQLDNETQKFGLPGKWRVWKLIGSREHSSKIKVLGEGDTPAEALRVALASQKGQQK